MTFQIGPRRHLQARCLFWVLALSFGLVSAAVVEGQPADTSNPVANAITAAQAIQIQADLAELAATKKQVRTFSKGGKSIDEIIVNGRPPKVYRATAVIVPQASAAAGVNVLTNAPAFNWTYGCSATAAGMMMGYYDNNGYPNMYAGPTNGGVCPMNNETYWGTTSYPSVTCGECPLVATHIGKDGRSVRGHVDDYWIDYNSSASDPYIGNWTEHTSGDCTGDFMGTNQSKFGNVDGSTTFYYYTDGSPLNDYTPSDSSIRDGCHGLKLFAESRGYAIAANFSQYIPGYKGNSQGFTYANFQTEIDAGRPVLIQLDGHTMLGFGYDNTSGNAIYVHDTWDHNSHTMTWAGSYSGLQHYGVTVFRLAGPPTVTGITPNSGVNTGTVSITNLAGMGFLSGAAVKLTKAGESDVAATGVNVVSATQITCTFDLTGRAVGAWNVVVTNTDNQTGTLANGFTISYPPPTVTGITPSSGMNNASVNVTNLAGTGFQAGAAVKLTRSDQSDLAATNVAVVSATTITCTVDLTGTAAGLWNVVVTNPDTQMGMLANGFTVIAFGSMTFLSEPFESTFVNGAPPGWSKLFKTNATDWVQNSGDHRTPGAHGGDYNALLYYPNNSSHETYLITPVLNFPAGTTDAKLVFWHKQAKASRQDNLTVSYSKTGSTGPWTQIAAYSSNMTDWTQETISLPNLSTAYCIGFLGNAKNGYGVCLDDVTVTGVVAPGSISGTLVFQDFSGDQTGVPVTVQLRKAGGGTSSRTVYADGGGHFSMTAVEAGTYDVWFKPDPWLAKVKTAVVAGGSNTDLGTVGLTNGDCDGNNAVTGTDMSILLPALDGVPTSGTDLDGNGTVDSTDLSILLSAMDRTGDL